LIAEENMVVTLSHAGYVKAQALSTYQAQRRGGKGKSATNVKDEDFLETLVVASSHDTVLCFSNRGRVYWVKVYDLPQGSRAARGKPIVNVLPLQEGERITALLPLRVYTEDHYVFMATGNGTVKKTPLADFSRPRTAGIIAVDLDEGDKLIGVSLTDGQQKIMLFTTEGKVICFPESDVRAMGRTARGVRGIRLGEGQRVIAMILAAPNMTVLTATANGYGKRTPLDDYPVHGRGGQGVIAIQTTERNGEVIGAIPVAEEDEVMLISDQGTLVRTPAAEISVLGRNTQGVRLIRLQEDETLIGVERVVDEGGDEEGAE
jgi:DNA gyrase subunit A